MLKMTPMMATIIMSLPSIGSAVPLNQPARGGGASVSQHVQGCDGIHQSSLVGLRTGNRDQGPWLVNGTHS
jgi:hypothetical protein